MKSAVTPAEPYSRNKEARVRPSGWPYHVSQNGELYRESLTQGERLADGNPRQQLLESAEDGLILLVAEAQVAGFAGIQQGCILG
jgi:hypothetical protein